jgi:DNA-binding XRE family transcriptional regulator
LISWTVRPLLTGSDCVGPETIPAFLMAFADDGQEEEMAEHVELQRHAVGASEREKTRHSNWGEIYRQLRINLLALNIRMSIKIGVEEIW